MLSVILSAACLTGVFETETQAVGMSHNSEPTVTRRTVAVGAAVAVAGVAGCADASGTGTDADTTENDADEPEAELSITMIDFDAANEFRLLIQHNGEIIHWDGHELSGGSPPYRESLAIPYPDDATSLSVHARVAEQEASASYSAEQLAAGCPTARIVHDPDDAVSLQIFQGSGDCE